MTFGKPIYGVFAFPRRQCIPPFGVKFVFPIASVVRPIPRSPPATKLNRTHHIQNSYIATVPVRYRNIQHTYVAKLPAHSAVLPVNAGLMSYSRAAFNHKADKSVERNYY